MPVQPCSLTAAARQLIRTDLLLGVDFTPVRIDLYADDAVSEATEPPATSPEPEVKRTTSQSEAPAVTPSNSSNATALDALREEHEINCPHCTTATGHTQTVFGEGDPDARLMFIGEAPGADEDRTGRPFVGRAGQKLDQIIAAMGLERSEVYIANILKSRPPNNRTPLPDEVESCAPYLAEQIRIIRPRAIVALGGPSSKFLLQTKVGVTRLRGTWAEYVDHVAGLTIPVMPTFHPAYLLRNYTEDTRRKMWSDMQAVREKLAE